MSDSQKKSSIESGVTNKEYVKVLGGQPPKKDVKEIDRIHTPQGRKRAPGSVRV